MCKRYGPGLLSTDALGFRIRFWPDTLMILEVIR